jgi:hypothetical protein
MNRKHNDTPPPETAAEENGRPPETAAAAENPTPPETAAAESGRPPETAAAENPTPPDIDALLRDEAFLETYILGNEAVTARVIARYLRTLAGVPAVSTLNGSLGRPALSPPLRPKTLEECKKLAEMMLL